MTYRHLLQYGLDADGNLRHISEVGNGLSCNCVCPNCGESLIAKNDGLVKVAHFAHSKGVECEGACMSRIHILAQIFFQEQKWINLPEKKHSFLGKTKSISPRRKVQFIDVKLERHHKIDSKTLIPDCVGIDRNGKELWIEIVVTHGIDAQKKQFIIDHDIACVEFDLRGLSPDAEESQIYQRLTSNCYSNWIHFPGITEEIKKFEASVRAEHKLQLENAQYHLVDYEVSLRK